MVNRKKFQHDLLEWFGKNKRDLPFRRTKNPYNIWLSEIMLQQTTMAVVIPYYEKFIHHYPSINDAARASEESLLNLWKGLGYYSRVRNFQKACQYIVDELNGKFPESFTEIMKLKGVGEYTASAIASISFKLPHAVVDGNVKRVMARLFSYEKNADAVEAKLFFKEKAQDLLDTKNPGDFNEAVMELGATICTKSPQCLICPLNKHCSSVGNSPERLPIKNKTSYISVNYSSIVLHFDDKILLKKPCKNNLIQDMWELPSCYDKETKKHIPFVQKNIRLSIGTKKLNKIGNVKHSITNKRITTQIYAYALSAKQLTKMNIDDFKLLDRKELDKVPLNTLSQKALKKFYQYV